MNTQALLIITVLAAIPVAIVLIVVFPPRLRAERRARALLAEHPSAERTSIYVAFASAWPTAKRQQIDDQIKDMSRRGWTFLRAREAVRCGPFVPGAEASTSSSFERMVRRQKRRHNKAQALQSTAGERVGFNRKLLARRHSAR